LICSTTNSAKKSRQFRQFLQSQLGIQEIYLGKQKSSLADVGAPTQDEHQLLVDAPKRSSACTPARPRWASFWEIPQVGKLRTRGTEKECGGACHEAFVCKGAEIIIT
jgi:hypothetical protein